MGTSVAAAEPAVAEVFGGQQVYADGAIVRLGREVHTVIFYRDQDSERSEVLRVILPPSGFAKSLLAAWKAWTGRGH